MVLIPAIQEFAATGKSIQIPQSVFLNLKMAKIINTQLQTDRLGFLQELDVLPVDLTLLQTRKTAKDRSGLSINSCSFKCKE